MKRIKELEDENLCVKKMYAEECLISEARKEDLEGKWQKQSLGCEMAKKVLV